MKTKSLLLSLGVVLTLGTASMTAQNIYPSQLSSKLVSEGKYTISFTLNANAKDVKMKVYNGTNLLKTIEMGALNKGTQAVDVDINDISGEGLTWEIMASADPFATTSAVKFADKTLDVFKFKNTRGISVDNNMESPYFGRVYITESAGGDAGGRTTQNGIYVVNSALEDVLSQGATAFTGNVTWSTSSSPMRLSVAPDGTVYMCDWSDNHSGVWKADPSDLSKSFFEVFGGTRNTAGLSSEGDVNIHGSISGVYVEGSGENTVLYTMDEDMEKGKILKYNIGNLASQWVSAPSATVFSNTDNLIQNACNMLAPDGKGGWWMSQYRYDETATIPALIHANKLDAVDFNSGSNDATMLYHPWRGAFAVSHDGTKLAYGVAKAIKILGLTYDESGKPTVTLLSSIVTGCAASWGMAFDVADNVYLSGAADGVEAYALPKTENAFTAKAPSKDTMVGGKTTGVDEVSGNDTKINLVGGEIEINARNGISEIEIYSISGQLLYHSDNGGATNAKINASEWANGVYVVKANGATKKIIK